MIKKRRGRKPSKYKSVFWEALPHSTQKPIGSILEEIDRTTKEGFMSIDKPHELETLSQAVAKLPAYLKGLGYYLADAENVTEQAKDDLDYVKLSKEKITIDDGKSVAESERIVAIDSDLVKAKDELRSAKHTQRVLRLQYDSSIRQFEGWRSRLTVIRNDLKEGQ